MDGKQAVTNGREQQQWHVLGKRPFGEIEEENQQQELEEEKEGLVALVKRRLEDVQLLENEISFMEAKLAAKMKAYDDAMERLRTLEVKCGSVKSGKESEGSHFKHSAGQTNGHGGFRGGGERGERGADGQDVTVGNPVRGNVNLGEFNGGPGVESSSTPPHGKAPTTPAPRAPRSTTAAAARLPGGGDTPDANRYPAKPARAAPEHSGGREATGDPGFRRGKGRDAQSDNSGVASDVDGKTRSAQDRSSGGSDPVSQKKAAVATPATIPQRPQPQKRHRQKHIELISSISSKAKGQSLSFYPSDFFSSQHRRKMRSLVLNPSSENQCATSALDGVINFWQIQPKSLDINFRNSVDCLSDGQRHWPEDLAWHPDGQSLFAVYTADPGDSQVSIIRNDSRQKNVKFLPQKPHVKGVMNGIAFMPWSSSVFVTGGGDHMVNLWREQQNEVDVWKPKHLHSIHTSAVIGVAGTQHKQLVLSAGYDKRVIGFDPASGRAVFRHELESKAMTVLPNPVDFNLFMVQTGHGGQANQQLHLFDIRTSTQLHSFGWKQESSATQSALITQSWSPDGYYIASGSVDPKIFIFDIRYNGKEPAQTIKAHSKRVFMAVWHQTLPMLLSISSDLNIGVHRISES